MLAVQTEKEDQLQATDNDLIWRWHDNIIYGMRFDIGDIEKEEWRSDLVFDIDFIAEWICDAAGAHRFRVAPATLVFHNAGDLQIAISHGDSQGRNALSDLSIDRVTRERIDGPFEMWRWTVQLNAPAGGLISFCASGYTQTLRGEPRCVSEQRLRFRDR
jgi:hypothetical protein